MHPSVRTAAALFMATLIVAGTGAAASARPPAPPGHGNGPKLTTAPDTIEVVAENLFPESVGYDARRQRFVVGSVTQGSLSTVAMDGTLTLLSDDPRLIGAAGLRVDAPRDRVLATNLTPDNSVAGVASIDLATGETEWYVDLAAVAGDGLPHFTNDVTVAPDGTAYLVDALSPVVYRVDRNGNASVLVESSLLSPDGALPGFQPTFGSLAITWLPGDVLLVMQVDGTVLRIPVRKPATLSEVTVPGLRTFVDSVVALPGGEVGVVTHGWFDGSASAAQTLRSDDGWRTARITSTKEFTAPFLTAITEGPGHSYFVMDSAFERVFQGQGSEGFTLNRVELRR